jgi:hypothetical protein
MEPDIEFTALFLLAFSSCILALATLPHIFWRMPGTRFALVVSLLLVYGFLTLAPLAFLRAFWRM